MQCCPTQCNQCLTKFSTDEILSGNFFGRDFFTAGGAGCQTPRSRFPARSESHVSKDCHRKLIINDDRLGMGHVKRIIQVKFIKHTFHMHFTTAYLYLPASCSQSEKVQLFVVADVSEKQQLLKILLTKESSKCSGDF